MAKDYIVPKTTLFELAQTTVAATSPAIDISDLDEISLQCFATNITNGNCSFAIQLSNKNSAPSASADWTAVAFVDNLANTNAQNLTRVTSKSLTVTDTNFMVFLDRFVRAKWLRVVGTVTTDGKYSAYMFARRKT